MVRFGLSLVFSIFLAMTALAPDSATAAEKLAKAGQLGVPILDEAALRAMLSP